MQMVGVLLLILQSSNSDASRHWFSLHEIFEPLRLPIDLLTPSRQIFLHHALSHTVGSHPILLFHHLSVLLHDVLSIKLIKV